MQDTVFLSRCEERFQQARRALDETIEQRQAIEAREARLSAEVESWATIISAERERMGLPTDADDEEKNNSKTELIRSFIAARANSGMTPKEIRDAALARGIEAPTSFPYNILSRLKSRREIFERGGRYYPSSECGAEKDPEPLLIENE